MGTIAIVDCFHFLFSPRVKVRLKEYLVQLKLYETRRRELNANIQKLKEARDSVQHKVDEEGNRYGNGIHKEVADWIKAVDKVISECNEFNADEDHQLAVFDLFNSGYLPKTGIRYRLSKKAFAITSKVNGLLQTAKHDTYSYWLGPPSIASFFHTVGYESFPSREESMKNIKEALKSPNVRVIGLHGLSGVGKTTMAKKIARDALQALEGAKMFNVVVMPSLTRNPDIRKIQGHIADALGMKLDEESDMARAARIRKRLKNESTLIILDDIWVKLDLNMIGIPLDVDDADDQDIWTETVKEISSGNVKEGKKPGLLSKTKTKKETFGNLKEGKTPGEHRNTETVKEIPAGENSKTKSEGNSSVINTMKSRRLQNPSNMKTEETFSRHKGCKVLLISESKQVLLSQMGGEENSIYFIKVLKEKEAEEFFKKMAGLDNGKTEFDKLMMSIVNKCNGLPMSIVTTARALKDQSQSVWEDALRKLERGNFTGTSDFSTKLSYDLLENEELKRAFLLSAGMGPDTLIMDLMKYCVGLGFLQRIYTVREARDRVCVLVGKLKESGLLSDSYSSDRFTMQDIIRSVALSIASKDRHAFTRTKEQIDEWPDKLERYAIISLHYCHIIDGFPRRINYPRLRFFQVNNNDRHLQIPDDFFKGMKELKVLIFTGISLSLSDSSADSLTELRMLSLEQCLLLDENLSVLGKLKKLRILSFSGSDIEKLPVELKQLKKLQIFDISNCSKLRKIPPNVISSLISLEELYMRNTLIQWEDKEHNCQSEKASLSELRHLNKLTTLDIHIPNAAYLPKNLFFDKFDSYKIVVGDLDAYSDMDVKIPEKYESSRFLAIQLKNGFDIHSQKGIKVLFEGVETLFLEELNGVLDIFFALNLKGFPYLKHLLIVNNSDIQSLIDPKDRQHTETAFPKLESLHLYNLKSMGGICSCKLSESSFGKLKVIKINLCAKLINVVLFSVISLLTVLETIEVSECNALKGIVTSEIQSSSNESGVLKFPELRSLILLSLPELIGFYLISSEGENNSGLFNEKVELPKLERMVLSSIQIDKIWSDQSSQISQFKNLIHMDVSGCWNLEYLMSFSMAKSLVNLQILSVSECEKMSYIFPQGQDSQPKIKVFEPKQGNIFPNLKNIKVSSMSSLKEIWNSKLPSNSFEMLDTLIIEKCDKLIKVFPCDVKCMFWSLCNLRVTDCKSMKAVFELDVEKRNGVVVPNMQDVYLETLPKLEHVWKWKNDLVGILQLKGLQKMWVRDCNSLENIFPASIAKKFPSLEYLVIWDCSKLNVIIPDSKKEGTNKEGTYNDISNPVPLSLFEFPNLTTIKFSELPKFSGLYPGAYKLSCPKLNDLSIEYCDRLEPFKKATPDAPRSTPDAPQTRSTPDAPQTRSTPDASQTRSTVFSKEVINKLKCMKIESWHAKSSTSYMGEGNHRQDNLEELSLSRLTNSGILYSFLHRNPNLKSLSLNNCFVTDIVPLKVPTEIENSGVVPKLERLMLIDMPDLETIGFEGGIILERIELLILNNCPLLVNIMPSSVSLTHLTNLEVVNCGGLKILMPLSAAKSLVQLNRMKVIGCESMEEIVENENGGKVGGIVENAVKVDIVFRKLRVLELLSLKNLNSFSESCVIEFLSLEKLVVSGCPKMKTFSVKVKTSPLLEKVFFVHEKEKKISCWKVDLNTTILKIFEEKKFFEGMDEISLSEHHDLLLVWNGGDNRNCVQRSWFNCLKILKLVDCEDLICAIPYNTFLCLTSLKELEVQNCNKVEVIFENLKNNNKAIQSQLNNLTLDGLSKLKHVWGKDYKGNIRFQNLLHVFVSNCEGLETLFPEAIAKNIAKLETLRIEFCQNLIGIVAEKLPADVAKQLTPDVAEKLPPDVAEKLSPDVAEQLTPDVAEKLPPDVAEQLTPDVAEKLSSDVAEKLPPDVAEKLSPDVAEKLSPDVAEKFVFPCLTSLLLDNLPQLTYFYCEIFTVECPELRKLEVLDCSEFELFQSEPLQLQGVSDGEGSSTSKNRQPLFSNFKAISSLEKLSIDWIKLGSSLQLKEDLRLECLDEMRLFFDVEDNGNHTFPSDIFAKAPNLQELTIGWCKSLDRFQTPNLLEISKQLEILTLQKVFELKIIWSEDSSWLNIVCKKLHILSIVNCPELTKLYRSPSAVYLPNLKELYITECHSLEYLFTSSVTKVLPNLEKIIVKESQSIKKIVEVEQNGTPSQELEFKHLHCISLDSLSSLQYFYPGHATLKLPALALVNIQQCPNMEVFSQGHIKAESFRGIHNYVGQIDESIFHEGLNGSVKVVFLLQMLSEGGMDGTEFVNYPELDKAWKVGLSYQDNWIYSLKILKLVNCNIESYAIPSKLFPWLKSLQTLEVRSCNKVKGIFANNVATEIPSKLSTLILEDLSTLTHVWETNFQGVLQFQNLKQVRVSGCKSIQTLFPAVLAKNLKRLEALVVAFCDKLQGIVGKEDEASGSEKMLLSFPQLTSLEFEKLLEFAYFCPEMFTVDFPKLNHFSVLDCPKLELFHGANPEGENECVSTSISRQPFIPNLNAISILEELVLDWKHISVLRLGLKAEDLKYLKSICLLFNVDMKEKATLPIEILEKIPNLQELWLGLINNLEIFLTQNTMGRGHGILGQLKTLALYTVSELKYINLEESWLNILCQTVHILKVVDCPDLNKVFHSSNQLQGVAESVSYSSMKELHICGCHGLRYLFTCSVTKALPNLETISVKESQSITEIVATEQDGKSSQEVKFERLCYIELNSLPRLKYFYSGNETLQLQALTQVDIWQCPNMAIFSVVKINAESFRGIQASNDSNDGLVFENNDLNASVRRVFLQQDHLVFEDSPLLKFMWLKSDRGVPPHWCFCNLISLVVEGCEFLADAVLPSHILPLLSNLKTLEVGNCNSIKAIFVNIKIGPQESLGLPFLEKLRVENCKQLLEIVANEEIATNEANEVIAVLPKMKNLKLCNLDNLRCIYPGVHTLEWPMLIVLDVTHCPQLKFFTTEFQSSRDLHSEYQDSFPTIQKASVSLEKVTPSLKVLTLGKEEAKMMEQGKLHVDLQELNMLRLQCFDEKTDVFPFVFHSKVPLPSPDYLVVRDSAFKEIFPAQTPDIDYTNILSQLKTLELYSLPELESIGFEHCPFIENLQNIHVLSCASLTNLTPSTVSFSKLRYLNVNNCHRLKNLFTFSTAKTLSVLKEIKLFTCESIIEIVAKEEDEPNEGEMPFMELSILTLGSLPKLGSFYSGSFTLNFSSLKEVSFTKCNSTKVFRLGDEVPDELKVTIDGVLWEGDKNGVIMQQSEVPDELKVTIDGVLCEVDENGVIMQQIDEEA